MNINKLFENLQEEDFVEQLKGELSLEGNCIVWTFDINNNNHYNNEQAVFNDDDDDEFSFTSPAEIIQEAYDEDLLIIENLIADIDDTLEWTFSDPDVNETTISFKIF